VRLSRTDARPEDSTAGPLRPARVGPLIGRSGWRLEPAPYIRSSLFLCVSSTSELVINSTRERWPLKLGLPHQGEGGKVAEDSLCQEGGFQLGVLLAGISGPTRRAGRDAGRSINTIHPHPPKEGLLCGTSLPRQRRTRKKGDMACVPSAHARPDPSLLRPSARRWRAALSPRRARYSRRPRSPSAGAWNG
jgi:hypothetical protein